MKEVLVELIGTICITAVSLSAIWGVKFILEYVLTLV